MNIRFFAIVAILGAPTLHLTGADRDTDTIRLENGLFRVEFDRRSGGVVMLRRVGDAYDTNYVIGPAEHPEFDIDDARWLGHLVLRCREAGGAWRVSTTPLSPDVRVIRQPSKQELVVEYLRDSAHPGGLRHVKVRERYRLEGNALHWDIEVRNSVSQPIEIGDLAAPLLFNSFYVQDPIKTYTQRVIRHHVFSGDQTFAFWMRPNGEGPFLLMTPTEGTRFEYFDRVAPESRALADLKTFKERSGFEGLFTAYIHSGVQATEIEARGSWRLPHAKVTLAPAGQSGDAAHYGFRFEWAADYDAVREALVQNGLLDVQVVPGMTIPVDLAAKVALRTRQDVHGIRPEHPGETKVSFVRRAGDTRVYEIRFARLGENMLTVDYGRGRRMYMEFFVTEPLETLIKKRASFIAANQQIRGSDKWYEGEFSQWSMADLKLRTPDEPGPLHPYMVGGGDDPSLCKAPFIATKNVHFPDPYEIEKIEYYLASFVWGKLQRTDAESPFPFGIYGTDSWFLHRFSNIGYGSGGNGREHMWRTFDYTHVIQLYYNLYRIAKMYAGITHYLDAKGYLDRALGTARAFYEVPYSINMGKPWAFRGWCDWAYKQGNFHELYIPSLISALESEGRKSDADWLQGEWEKKVKYMVYDHPYPFGSEMYFDSTAFESTQAVAAYGMDNEIAPDKDLWRDKNTGVSYSHPSVRREDFARFMERSISGNIAARGWLETSFWQLGSDIRQHGNSNYMLSYMTQMGGWAILDYAARFAKDPEKYLRLGYASFLGSWALVNSGTESSHYGYWYPGKANDGAAGWAFGPEKYFRAWAGFAQGRGAWQYDGEIDNGFSGALRTAATIVVRDPIFGEFAYGGDLITNAESCSVVLRDGLRQRLRFLNLQQPVYLELDRDGFSQAAPVKISRTADRVSFTLENRWANEHEVTLAVSGLHQGHYSCYVSGKRQMRVEQNGSRASLLRIAVGCDKSYPVLLAKDR